MTLAEKIATASIAVGAFTADKINKEQGYAYISADQILSKAGDALAKVGVAVIPQVYDEEVTATPYGNQGKNRFDARIVMKIALKDGDETFEAMWIGRGSDYAVPDKALYKAITSGHKYFLMKLLNIGVGNEDGEHEGEEESKPAPKPANKQEGRSFSASGTQSPSVTSEKPELPKSMMTVEMAKSVKNSDGKEYGTLDSATLKSMLRAIDKRLTENEMTPEDKESFQMKKDAILVIQKSRQ